MDSSNIMMDTRAVIAERKNPEISIVVPFYNESEGIETFFETIVPLLSKLNLTFEIVCVNDGSRDDTLQKLLAQKQKLSFVRIVDFSRNFGKDAALTAGLDYASGNCVIPMDCDLQDPPELVEKMVEKWKEGYDVVLAKRADRSSDSFLKRFTAGLFYKFSNSLMDFPLPENVGDFRLMDRKVVDVIKTFSERTRFMKGLFAFAGFKSCTVEYKRQERARGTTKWNYWKLWNYAIDGVTSFSLIPLKLSTYFGLIVTIFAFLRGALITYRVLAYGIDVPGYASLMVAILFFGGVQLMSLGIIGEYVGRTYIESKRRPIYIVREFF